MRTVTYRIAPDHSILPLIDWYLFLFDKSNIARTRLHKRLTYGAVKKRLLRMRGTPVQPDIQRAAALLPVAETILDLGRLLREISLQLELTDVDPKFPWTQACRISPTVAPESLPWRMREQARFLTCAYKPVLWAAKLAPIEDHFVHLSTANPGLIAFTDTEDKGKADVQTPMKPGRYLAKFYPALADHQVRDLQETMPRKATLYFAASADDIERIYTTGPSSCMSHPAGDFGTPCHPVRVYGDSDLQLAYIKNKAGLPTARALVWPANKYFGRVYGHETLLRQQLEREGYSRRSLDGARIRRINIDDAHVVMPYIDDAQSFDVVDDQWLVIAGPYSAESTEGVGRITTMTYCERCEDRVANIDTYTVAGETWCDYCRDNNTFISDYSGDTFPDHDQADVFVRTARGRTTAESWSTSERDDHATYCDGSEQWYATDHFNFVRLKNGQSWLASYFAEHGDPADLAADNDNPSNATAEGRAAA